MSVNGGRYGYENPPIQDREIMTGIVGSTILRSIAASAILLFLPVYLYQVGGLNLTVGWLVASRALDFLLMEPIARVIGKLGFKTSVLIGEVMWAIALLAIMGMEQNVLWLWVALIIVPFAAMAYWIPRHMLFMETSRKNFGQDESRVLLATRWSAALGPILGGILVAEFGFSGVWVGSAVLMVAAAVPILLIKSEKLKWEFDLPHYWQKLTGGWFRKDLLAFVGLGIEEAMYDYIWPIFLLIALNSSHVSLGAYKTVVLGVTSVVVWLVGRKVDHGGIRKFMMAATVILGGVWILRGMLSSGWDLLALDVIDGWIGILVFLPFTVYTYRRAITSDKKLYLIEREAALRLGAMIAGLAVWGLNYVGIAWEGMVWVGVVGLALMNFLPKIGPKQMEEYSSNSMGTQ